MYVYLAGFSKRCSLKLCKKTSFCQKKPEFQTAVTWACLLLHRCAFLQKIANPKISLFNPWNFLRAIFPFSQNALERLYCGVILTEGFRSVFVSPFRDTRVSAQVSGLNQIPHKLAASFWDVCCLKCPNQFGYSDSCHFFKSLGQESLGREGGGWGGGVLGTLGL